ncbi:MAG: LSU ribosomal protein L5p (L11e) [Candidatus Kapaibacterium sp.]|jgi:large subunit ribosomal protein L5|nr:MAG: LSU ribosomal protein L5p (L11e) [Candidatus Kapabacteria bacterium]ROL58518.1 MAG: 50S ribosomal protein L5 [Bacteroidetes/Chlorobi group bacterium Naka2016]
MAQATKKKPQTPAVASKKVEFKPEGKRLEDVKEKEFPVPRLYEYYKNTIVPNLMKKFGYKSPMQVPRLEKIVLNMGVGGATQDQRLLLNAINELELIAGQRPAISRAKKSISNFKLRAGVPIGCFVTLRRQRMYEFLDRFINIAAPRIRDFRGFSDKSFDGHGNYSVGIKEQIIFPEIDVDKVSRITGLDITFVIRSNSDEESYALLSEFGFPFQRKE